MVHTAFLKKNSLTFQQKYSIFPDFKGWKILFSLTGCEKDIIFPHLSTEWPHKLQMKIQVYPSIIPSISTAIYIVDTVNIY